jgi:hypothetical protein
MESDFGPGATVENASAPPRPARERNAKKLDERLAELLEQTPVAPAAQADDKREQDKDIPSPS